MELPTAALGGMRLALQVTSQHRRPLLGVYFHFHNRMKPNNLMAGHHQEAFVQFWLVNIGGSPAENVELRLSGDFHLGMGKTSLSSLSIFQGTAFARFEPAQSFSLCRINERAFRQRTPDGQWEVVKDGFIITAQYDGPWSGLNRLLRVIPHLRGRRQYTTRFPFNTSAFENYQFPPAEYL